MQTKVLAVTVLLVAVSLAPSVAAQDGSGPRLVARLEITSDQGGVHDGFSALPTFRPDAELTFELYLVNRGDRSAERTLDSPTFTFALRDVFGRAIADADLQARRTAASQVTVPAGDRVLVADGSWSPKAHFDDRGSVVTYPTARAAVRLASEELATRERFKVEAEGLTVDAYGRSEFGGLDDYFPGQEVPVHLKNLADEAVSGNVSFTVRDADGRVFASEKRHLRFGPSESSSTRWAQVTDAGTRVEGGTYLVRVQLADSGTVRFDEYPVRIHRGPQIRPVPSLTVDPSSAGSGEEIRFTLTLRNPNPEPYTLEFPTSQEIDVHVTRPDGSTWRWSDGRQFLQQTSSREILAGGQVSWNVTARFNQTGEYRATAVVTARDRLTSNPALFSVGQAAPSPPTRTCSGATVTQLRISLTDGQGHARTTFPSGASVQIDLVNTGETAYDRGALLTVRSEAGETLHEAELARGRMLHPGQARTFVWDQTGPDGEPVPDGRYRARVRIPDGSVAVGFAVGNASSSSGQAGGEIQSTACSYTVPGYYHALDVRTERPTYRTGENVTVTYRADRPLKGDVRFVVFDGGRERVFETTARLNTTLEAGETASFTWDQRALDGSPAGDGFYMARVEVSGLAGEAPFFVGSVDGVPTEGADARAYQVIDPPRTGPPSDWDDAALNQTSETYGQTYLRWLSKLAEQREELLEQARRSGLHGSFRYDGEVAEGSYVTFAYDEDGRVTAYSVAPEGETPVTLFNSVVVRPFEAQESGATAEGLSRVNPLVAGPLFLHQGRRTMLNVNDVPRGVMMLRSAESTRVDFTVADGFTARASSEGSCVDVSGNLTATICVLGDGELRVTDKVVSVELTPGSQLAVAVLPSAPDAEATLLERGITEGEVGAEISLVSADSAQPVIYTPGFRSIDSEPLAGDDGAAGLRVTVDRTQPEGTVLVFRVPRDVLNATTSEDVGVQLDGEEVLRAQSLRSVLDPADEDEPRYVVVVGQVVEVALYVPHFSERTVTIQNLAETLQEPAVQRAIVQSFLVAAVVTLAAAVAVFRKPE